MNVLIGGAWPYANGSLHVGHIAGLIPGDVLARYYRAKGEQVLYVSGSDCHGTPIAIRAKAEGVSPTEIADRYHQEFQYCFDKLSFSYDCYSRTDDEFHKQEVQQIIRELYQNRLLYEKEVEQLYCEHCHQSLPDRYVEGRCPVCNSQARGDQCDHCGTLLEPLALLERRCKLCGNEPVVKKGKQLYFALSKLQEAVEYNLKRNHEVWRANAVNNTERYLREGLQDRAISRDLAVGIDIPIEGYEDKKVYVWIDAVLGYYTLSKKWGLTTGRDYKEFWNEKALSYYVHGKDNIPFHSVILPALLAGIGCNGLPDRIVSSEYLTLEGRKISTSGNWAVWLTDLVDKYNSDALRYYFLINSPEKRDADFSWQEFINSNNGELLGAYGNLVNRTLVFVKKSFDGKIPEGVVEEKLEEGIQQLYLSVGELIQNANIKRSLETIFEFIRSVNKYFDEKTPWITVNTDRESCSNAIFSCLYGIANLARLLEPFLPESSLKIRKWLKVEDNKWEPIAPARGVEIGEVHILFERLDKKLIEEERNNIIK